MKECILSLDQGTKITGYAIFKNKKLMISGILQTNSKDGAYERIYDVAQRVNKLIDDYKPDILVLEEPFAKNSMHVFEVLCELYGVLGYVAQQRNIQLKTFTAAVWRAILGLKGKNRAEQKLNAINSVEQEFGLQVSEDEAEAILIGLAYIREKEKEESLT